MQSALHFSYFIVMVHTVNYIHEGRFKHLWTSIFDHRPLIISIFNIIIINIIISIDINIIIREKTWQT